MVNKALLLLYQHLHDISNNSNAPVTKETENRQNKQNYVKNYALICGGRQKGGGGGEKRETRRTRMGRWQSLLFFLPPVPPLPLPKAR